MKIICSGLDLSDAVSKVAKACATRSTNPILECIKLVASGGTLKLIATDLELGIERSIKASTPIEGETVVPGALFGSFVSRLKYEQVELTLMDNVLRVKYGDSEVKFVTMSATDFPSIAQVNLDQSFSMSPKDLRDLVSKVVFAVGHDDSRPLLKGVLIEVGDNIATAVALDGYRLAKCRREVSSSTGTMKAIVPARSLNEIARALSDGDKTATIYIQKSYLLLDLGHTKITTRLLEGDYVDYNRIIPSSFETTTVIPVAPFADGLVRATLLAKSDSISMVKFDIKDNSLLMSSTSAVGNLNERLVVKTNGNDIAIAFNASFFGQILGGIDTDTVTLKFTGPTLPCIITPTSTSDDLLYLLLPVRLM